MMEEKSDAELVELAWLGNKEAFVVLAGRHESAARRLALQLTRDSDLASELVQEATIRAYVSLEHLQDPSRFRGWLCGILRNVHRGYGRDQRRVQDLDTIQKKSGDSIGASGEPSPESSAEDNDLIRGVQDALGLLAPADRKVLKMFYFDDADITSMARELAVSEVAAKVRLHRARKRLRSILERHHIEFVQHLGRKTMVEVSIMDVIKQEQRDSEGKPYVMYVVVLVDRKVEHALPIWVGVIEGQSIAQGIAKYSLPRPMTLDLTAKLMEAAGVMVEHVRVESLKESTFYGVIRLRGTKGAQEVDARPSDALALAVRLGCPIFASEAVFSQASIAIPPGTSKDGVGIRSVLKEIEQFKQRWTAMSKFGAASAKEAHEQLLNDLLGHR
jgi:RNA polymerase sigma factor (sigma-70 family)